MTAVVRSLPQLARPIIRPINPMAFPTSIRGNGGELRTSSSTLFGDRMPPGPWGPISGTISVDANNSNDGASTIRAESISVYDRRTGQLVATLAPPEFISSEVVNPRGVVRNTYRIAIPDEKIDGTREYVLVLNASINGAEPQRLRSEPTKPIYGM